MTERHDNSASILLAENSAFLARLPSIIDQLPEPARARVLEYGHEQSYERGEELFHQGDPHQGIAIIRRGLIRSYYSAPSGKQISLAYWLPGNFVGGPDIFVGRPHMWSALAMRPTEVTWLPGSGLRELAREVPDLAVALLDALALKARCYSSLAQMLGTRSHTERLTQLLLHLAQTYGVEQPRAKGIAIATAFTHSEIANLIGATRQWVTITLNRLQKDGVLSQKRGLLVIHRMDLLASTDATDPGSKMSTGEQATARH